MRGRDKTFVFGFAISDEFAAKHPEAAARYIEVAKARIAKQATAVGPRGGTYRLISAPDVWESGADIHHFTRGMTQHVTRRRGRYVRPSRAPFVPDSVTFDTITIPVVEGGVTLPRGERVETKSRFVDVPVLA